MIYLDNAATSFPKPERVYQEMDRCSRNFCANPGRGGHYMAIASGKEVLLARERICKLLHLDDPMQICFCKNATEALNLAIYGCLEPNDHVITTCMEHNSVIRPLMTLKNEKNIGVTVVKGNEFGEIDIEELRKSITAKTKLIISALSSNVNGIIMPVQQIAKIAEEYGILFLVDASQGIGSIPLDMREMHIDMLAFPGHKSLLGPQGTGGRYVRKGLILRPLLQGGTGSVSENLYQPEFMPDLLESGTLNTPGIVGLRHGIEFLLEIGIENIQKYKGNLISTLYEGLFELSGISIYSKSDCESNSGIFAFNLWDIDSVEVCNRLNREYDIAGRAGLHCAPLAHKTLGTSQQGIIRLSVGCFNAPIECEKTIYAVTDLSKKLKPH